MHLIDTSTLKLREFEGDDIPDYAILSHRWGDEEVSYKAMQDGSAETLHGWTKIVSVCRLAKAQRLRWAWVDTCCIDKKSSAELSEAINSMWAWYRDAEICFVYLADVAVSAFSSPQAGWWDDPTCAQTFVASAWFTRGWTLQELLAPMALVFYDSAWNRIAARPQVGGLICRATGIERDELEPGAFRRVSIARRMSWAANRETKRVEDQAYSLLGLFEVNMPLLYGEGRRAFHRLQLEIMRQSDDESLFAWSWSRRGMSSGLRSMLAPNPTSFTNSADIVPWPFFHRRDTYTMTNRGLLVRGPMLQASSAIRTEGPTIVVLMILNCKRKSSGCPILVSLKQNGDSFASTDFSRLCTSVDLMTWNLSENGIKDLSRRQSHGQPRLYVRESFDSSPLTNMMVKIDEP